MESRDGFKAGLTLTSSGTMHLDKEQAHQDTGTLQTNGKYIAMWRGVYKVVAAKTTSRNDRTYNATILGKGIMNNPNFSLIPSL